ncbi:sugar phosphate isomerase/epimerase family protein [Neolewinella antarctica]|uniref:Sugar phosphate isomerase/epimerase n=1 Tax=Neolewinella antarctica TaxID=442734 RepID=A0ABX0XH87_9BACT|nr:sugar phosphate isomerase/epimerase family protein [Neolewinella antarctica]NJC28228.1 sugar phosphate isomerase/epimerase [Neolewinella antarctica]
MNRRKFIQSGALLASTLMLGCDTTQSHDLKLSLSQWALHRAQFGDSKSDYEQWKKWLVEDPDAVLRGTLNPLDFPSVAKDQFGFEAVEYVNTFFYGKNADYFKALRKRSDDAGVENLLIMVDEEGLLGDPNEQKRLKSVDRHRKWLNAATILGCHSIRVNAHSKGSKSEQKKLAADGLSRLCDYAKDSGLDVLIENHGGMSSEPNWLIDTIKATGSENIGTMVDFDNFKYSEDKIWGGELTYDRYEGVDLLMPYAKSVSAKSYAFDPQGNETKIDFGKMVTAVKESSFDGYISVEYEGEHLSEDEGILATKALLERFI